jgi:hypothetical protein
MKVNFVKQVMPVAVATLGIAGTFTTHAMNERYKTFALVQGYARLDPQGDECEEHDECSTAGNGYVCTVGYVPSGAQLFGINSAGKCTIPVYRP